MADRKKPIRGSEKIRLRARELRKRTTHAEKLLWEQLRNRRLNGLKFRRQHVLGLCIVDFSCPEHRLAVELDGDIRSFQEDDDATRTVNLEDRGVVVVRFWNYEVEECLDTVLKTILSACRHPSPTSWRRTGDEGTL